jgi:predicted ATPase
MIIKFGCKHIKAIRECTEIEIRPITIMMGENSSGKSSILQALSLLAVNKLFGNTIERIKYSNPFSNFENNDTFKNKGEDITLTFEILDNKEKHYIKLIYSDEKDNNEYGYLTEVTINDNPIEDIYNNDIIKKLISNLESIRHIGMLKEVKATYDYPNDYIGYFGEKYKNIVKNLSSKAYVNKCIKHIFGYEVKKIDKDTGDFYLTNSEIKKDLKLNMFGSSVSSTIPILTQFAKNREKDTKDKYRLTIIEEPEINEHPLSQARLIESLFPKTRPKNHYNIVETHSDHIVNKLRYLVAEKIIKHNDIVIYYKHKNSEDENIDKNKFYKIELNKCGKFVSDDFGYGGFPKGFFDATLDDLFQLGNYC